MIIRLPIKLTYPLISPGVQTHPNESLMGILCGKTICSQTCWKTHRSRGATDGVGLWTKTTHHMPMNLLPTYLFHFVSLPCNANGYCPYYCVCLYTHACIYIYTYTVHVHLHILILSLIIHMNFQE